MRGGGRKWEFVLAASAGAISCWLLCLTLRACHRLAGLQKGSATGDPPKRLLTLINPKPINP